MPRTEVTKKIWAYIKKNNLQDKPEGASDDQRRRQAEEGLRRQGFKVSMFEMTKHVNNHLK
jgi:upstream activation factor subunit UAF30